MNTNTFEKALSSSFEATEIDDVKSKTNKNIKIYESKRRVSYKENDYK